MFSYATILWVCNTKGAILTGEETDPNNQWTGSTVISLNNQSISFALVGPKRLFNDPIYSPMVRSNLSPSKGILLISSCVAVRFLGRRRGACCTLHRPPPPTQVGLQPYQCPNFRRHLRELVSTLREVVSSADDGVPHSYGYISNFFFTWFILGTINNLYFKRCTSFFFACFS